MKRYIIENPEKYFKTKAIKFPLKPQYCKMCGISYYINHKKIYCSDECRYSDPELKLKLRKAGINSSKSQNRRSKNEIHFYELCNDYFNNVKHNEPIFNGWDADVIIEDVKIAVLWNGAWHYKKITKKTFC